MRRNVEASTRFKLTTIDTVAIYDFNFQESEMKKLLFTLIATSMTINTATAECWGTDNFQTCSDDYGNSYDVSRIGDYTYVDGYNSRTGSRWSSESMTIGDQTYQSGRDANGNSWNQTISNYGDTTIYSGRDSDGNYFSRTCTTHWDGSRSCY